MDVFFQNIIGAQLFPHHMVQILTEISNNGGGGEEEKGEERAQLQLENFFEKYNHYDVIAIIRQKVSFVYIFVSLAQYLIMRQTEFHLLHNQRKIVSAIIFFST